VYEILDARGFEIFLVNARHTKNLPGRKSDVQESQWLPKLHTYGLLRNSFHPPAEIRVVRTYWRQRGDHVHAVSTYIQRMQKALTQMNIQLANVISDLSGWTGQRIVRTILAGEQDPDTLAALSHLWQTRRPKSDHAMAHKLARLVYRLLTWGHEYVDQGLEYYETRHREQQVHLLKKRAAKLGLQIIEPDMA